MITVIVKYKTSRSYTIEDITRIMRYGAESIFKDMPHLYNKQFCFDVETSQGVSVYLWDSKESASDYFNEQFLQQFEQSMGAIPTIEFYKNIVTVDNRAGDVMPANSVTQEGV